MGALRLLADEFSRLNVFGIITPVYFPPGPEDAAPGNAAL